jgi:hypothetical protein
VSASQGTTKAINHLREVHNKVDPKKALNPQSAPQGRPSVYVPDRAEFGKRLAKLVAAKHLSFSFIECPEWQDLMQFLLPDAWDTLPRSADFVRDSAVRLYKEQKTEICKEWSILPYRPTLSFDVYTASNHLPILGVVGYRHDGHGGTDCILLGMRIIDGSHTGKNQATIIETLKQEYGIEPEDVVAHVVDHASNNGTALDALGDIDRSTRVGCNGHSLNLAARAFLNELDNKTSANESTDEMIPDEAMMDEAVTDEAVTNVTTMGPISKIRQLAIYVNRSPPIYQQWLKTFKTNIKKDNKTRWNSVVAMLDSVLGRTSCPKLTEFLNHPKMETSMKGKLQELEISQCEWNTLEAAQKLLKPLETCTMKLQGATSLFVSVDS